MKSITKLVRFSSLALLMASAILTSVIYPGNSAPQMGLTTTTDKSAYYIREKVTALGNVTRDGSPVSDALVALEMRSQNDVTMAYRTATVGNPSARETWVLNITSIDLWDIDFNPLNTVKIGETVLIGATVTNPQLVQRDHVYITISVFDGNMIPLRPYMLPNTSIPPQSSSTVYGQFYILNWTYSGMATIYVNVYDGAPADGGIPYAPEKSAQFYVSRTQHGWFNYSSTASTYTPSQTSSGAYSLAIGLPPTLTPGTYSIYSTARYREDGAIYRITNSTTFNVLSASFPPTASFVWLPPQPYPNMTITFDGSSSSAEGFDDVIIQYEWDFGDGTPKVVKSGDATNPPDPTVTHRFIENRQYIVTLNVTDNEGLWSLIQKPLTLKPTNPTAAFTWTSETARIDTPITFNASASQPGWSIRTASPAPIENYVWNFGDGTGNFTVTIPVLDHIYAIPGNFTVLLEVIDAENQQDSVIHIVQVQNVTTPIWDVNGDGKVDIRDIATVAKAYGTQPGDPNWNPNADITGPEGVPDGKVDIRDVALVSRHFGETY